MEESVFNNQTFIIKGKFVIQRVGIENPGEGEEYTAQENNVPRFQLRKFHNRKKKQADSIAHNKSYVNLYVYSIILKL